MAKPGPADSHQDFERRKQDHIRLSMDLRSQAQGAAGFDLVSLVHEALPDLNFSEISITTKILGLDCSSPFYISSMTAGHARGEEINTRLAQLSHARRLIMGVGSQRKELFDASAHQEWKNIRIKSPGARFVGNLGIAQVIESTSDDVLRLVDSLEAVGLFIHLNPLQECLQPEGTPNFRGGLRAIERLCKALPVPVIVKEVGCGFSATTAARLEQIGVRVLDVSGLGGTHWGRIEGLRSSEKSHYFQAAETFKNWGIPTVTSLLEVQKSFAKGQIWASGGVRNGLDAAKLLAMGAGAVGMAQPFLAGALDSEEALFNILDRIEYELKIALFCTGSANLEQLQSGKVWTWNQVI
jgi:isopentenyl-diphosphate delta-isomerase